MLSSFIRFYDDCHAKKKNPEGWQGIDSGRKKGASGDSGKQRSLSLCDLVIEFIPQLPAPSEHPEGVFGLLVSKAHI